MNDEFRKSLLPFIIHRSSFISRHGCPMKLISHSRWLHCLLCVLLLAVSLSSGCSQDVIKPTDFSGKTPIVRVLIFENVGSVSLTAREVPSIRLGASSASRRVDLPPGTAATLTYSAGAWRLGSSCPGWW